ncbi:uncharacterized protein LOC62_05G006885 [Vanrija pseudolonga]|uniref:Uncharacterized protein n=1 Tax=Vanrija pseudolonga TaxID=143232 RepID=A0AAF0YAZ2_9TREE|nr:hypothetical protein LOC62_05G006885 [Vanrija pseudolonga]
MANPPEFALIGLFLSIALVLIFGPSKRTAETFATANYPAQQSLSRAETQLAEHWARLVTSLIALDDTVGEDRADGFGRREAIVERIEIASRELARVRAALKGQTRDEDWVEVKRALGKGAQ